MTTAPMTEAAIKHALKAEQWIYLVVGPNVWGKGFTQDQAHTAAGKPKHWIAYASADPWIVVDGMGGLCYTPTEPIDRTRPTYIEIGRKTQKRTARR